MGYLEIYADEPWYDQVKSAYEDATEDEEQQRKLKNNNSNWRTKQWQRH